MAYGFVTEEVQQLYEPMVTDPVIYKWAILLVVVPKKDGSLWRCHEYWKLKPVRARDIYPYPRINECIDSLKDAEIFSMLDTDLGSW